MSNTLVDVIQEITERGWRVHFEDFQGREGTLFFTIITKGVPYSSISGAVSKHDLAYAKMGAVDALAYHLERNFETLKRKVDNPYGGNPEANPTEAEPVYGGDSDQDEGLPRSGYGFGASL